MSVELVFNAAFMYAAILIVASLSGFFTERAGIANISIDGQMIFGALIFCIVGGFIQPKLGNHSAILPLLISSLVTILASSLFGFLTIKLKANQIVAGTAINLLAIGLGTFLSEPLGPIIDSKWTNLRGAYLVEGKLGDGIYATAIFVFLLAIVLAVGLFVMVKYTPFGLRLRAIGENPYAVDSQGINVEKYQWIATTISGALAGLAGGLFIYTNESNAFYGNVSGMGFLGLAILIAGAWRIPLLTIIAFVFSLLTQTFLKSSIPTDIGKMLPYAITLVSMVAFSKWMKPPKFVGQPYVNSGR